MRNQIAEEPVKAAEALALSAAELAERLGVSLRHLRRLDTAGKLPKPVRLGRCVRWRQSEIRAWLAAGAPDRKKWNSMKEAKNGN